MECSLKLAILALTFISSGQAQLPDQARIIGEDDPCARELGVASPSDNLSCEFVAPGGTRCYFRSELCDGDQVCLTGSDEGANFAALDCKFASKGTLQYTLKIQLYPIES